jgi:hypothetical protein
MKQNNMLKHHCLLVLTNMKIHSFFSGKKGRLARLGRLADKAGRLGD